MSDVPTGLALPRVEKYVAQRYRLFHRYDEGVILDEESWYSVTPEKIAFHIAERCAGGVVVDAFTGAGGNAIQMARLSETVIAIDNDPSKIQIARHNARVYGVEKRIEFVLGDAFDILPSLRGSIDSIFLSPPWGGPENLTQETFRLSTDLKPYRAIDVLNLALTRSSNVAFLVPRHTDPNDLKKVLTQLHPPQASCEVEYNYLGKKLKTATLYFGNLQGTNTRRNHS